MIPLLGAGFLAVTVLLTAPSKAPPVPPERKPAPAVPVVTALARRDDIAVYLTGLGSVTPLVTVTVRSRVDGQLMKVLFQEGDLVARGQTLVEIDRRPFEAQLLLAEGQLARDQALLDNSRHDLARYQLLNTQDSIARQQYDTQRSLVKQNEGAVEADRAQIDTAKLQIVYSRITAPITGRAGLRLVDPGNIVHVADANGIVVITQVSPIAVIFTIAEDSVPEVLEKLRAGEHPPVDAFDRDLSHQLASGWLLTVDNQIDVTTGTLKLKALFANEQDELFPNQFVNARLLLDVLRQAVVVPVAALQYSGQRVYVYVVRSDGAVEVRNVKAGPSQGDVVAIESGLAVGEKVVVDGADQLREGTVVVSKPPIGAPSDGGSP